VALTKVIETSVDRAPPPSAKIIWCKLRPSRRSALDFLLAPLPVPHTGIAAPGKAFDARPGLQCAIASLRLDLDDYPYEPPHELLRNLAPVLRAHGYAWAASNDL
jgi:hypothetical protein